MVKTYNACRKLYLPWQNKITFCQASLLGCTTIFYYAVFLTVVYIWIHAFTLISEPQLKCKCINNYSLSDYIFEKDVYIYSL